MTSATPLHPQTSQMARPTRQDVEDFLIEEAALLDEQEWDRWNDLFTDDGLYWVPATLGQEDPYTHVSIMLEDPLLRKVRIKRFSAPDAYSLQPFPRSVHLISNVRIEDYDEDSGLLKCRAKFIMLEYQRKTQTYGGTVRHELRWDGDTFKIQQKRVDLINADGVLDCINLYF